MGDDTMRLACPNCGAQYEVPEAAIPAAGREVQCSNCGTAWFQAHEEATRAAPQPRPEEEPTTDDVEPEPAPPPQRRLDPAVADILRTEAERERSARAAEAADRRRAGADVASELRDEPPLEQKPEARPRTSGVSRPAQSGVTTEPRGMPPPSQTGSRPADADPFPRVEDTDPSIRAADAARASLAPGGSATAAGGQRGGFRAGFWLGVVGCGAALGVYLLAEDLAELMPHAEELLARYVESIDIARAWLADRIEALRGEF